MDKKLRKKILEVLKEYDHVVYLSSVTDDLIKCHNYVQSEQLKRKVRDYLRVLGESGYVLIRESQQNDKDEMPIDHTIQITSDSFRSRTVSTYCLTEKGYMEFDPWYKKAWRFFTNDFAKILSLIATILSITATYISLMK